MDTDIDKSLLHNKRNLRSLHAHLCSWNCLPEKLFARETVYGAYMPTYKPHRNCLPETAPWCVGPSTPMSRTIARKFVIFHP